MFTTIEEWTRTITRDVMALWIAARDRRVPWYAKAAAGLVAAYALSPIDLIPDFIPVLGYLDDLILVPLGIAAAVRMIPQPLMIEFRTAAAGRLRHTSRAGLLMVLAIWVLSITAVGLLVGGSG